jgi:GntR family transcriptional regulator/MocR family aminotransferase
MASHLRHTRGVRCQPEQIIPLANTQCALDLMAQVLIDPGHSIHLEDPIAGSIRATFQRAGAWIFPLTSDNPPFAQEGAPPRLVVVSPSNSIPLGTQMPESRRLDILSAARQANAIIVEYDLGHDIIFAGSRGAAIQALGGEDHVIYLGSLCDTLGPYIQLTYLVVPADLVEPFCRAASERGYIPESYLLAALAAFIGDTKYAVHLKTLRGTYGERAVLMAEACRSRFGVASMMQPVGGLCASLRLPAGTNEAKLCHAARSQGISVAPLSRFYQARPAFPGVVFGLGPICDRLIGPMLSRFAELVEETGARAAGV